MKCYYKCVLGLISLVPISAFADANYTMYVTNTLNVPIIISHKSDKCVKRVEFHGNGPNKQIVYPGEKEKKIVTWTDKDNFGLGSSFCVGQPKELDLYAEADISESDKIEENSYKMRLRWEHYIPNWVKNWQSKIKLWQSDDKNVPFDITDALCSRKNNQNLNYCKDKWVDQYDSPNSVYVKFGVRKLPEGFFRFSSLNLGDVSVTTAYGKPMRYDTISNAMNLSELDGKFDVKFSKTTRFCKVRDGELMCPSTIGYWFTSDSDNQDYPDERFVFACHQTENNDVTCPWTTKNETSWPGIF